MNNLILLLLFSHSFNILSQDLHYSQYYASPLTTNPALTGNFDGSVRLSTNYRAQWTNVVGAQFLYNTPSASIDFNLADSKLGIGIVAVNDQTNNKTFNTLEGGLSASYKIKFWRMQMSFGLQGWYSQRYLDIGKLDNQFVSSDNATFQPIKKFDFNAGLFATYFYPNSKNKVYYGLSMFHLLQPSDRFSNVNIGFSLPFKPVFFGGGYFALRDKWLFLPNIMFAYQAGATQTNLGLTIGYVANTNDENNPNLTYFFGIHSRLNALNQQAIIPKFGIEYERIRLGVSYDFITNQLASTSRPNTIEFSLNYFFKNKKRSSDFGCAEFIYF